MSKKAITTLDILSSVISFFKTGIVVFIMMILQRAKSEKALAEVSEQIAKDNLKIEKLKAKNDAKTDKEVIQEYLDSGDDLL